MKRLAVLLLAWLPGVVANVEKVIFTSPHAQPLDPSINNLLLTPVSEREPGVRTYINASFPTEELPRGTVSWVLLEGLRPRSRYEVRICWPATQPTSFSIYALGVEPVFADPALLESLSSFAYARHAQLDEEDKRHLEERKTTPDPDTTLLFLQIFAASDYFSLNQTLMDAPPPVRVDVILDPYLFNVYPRSLLPTTLHVIMIATVAWFSSGWISTGLCGRRQDSKKSL